ncbi:MAG: peptidase S9, partial [Paludibacter sp.]|nr:peptidase S9 [Paludibacter sp.]
MLMALAVLATSCATKNDETPVIGKQSPKIVNGRMTPEILWSFGRIAGVQASADGKKILYSVSYYSVAENKGNSELFVMNADGSDKKQITHTATREAAAKWMKDGEHIAFLSSETGTMQLWMMKADGTDRKQISERAGGINDFLFSPDESKLLFIADVKYGERTVDKYPDLPKASGVIVTDLMYKHWDEWVQTVPHPFVADFKDNKIENEIDVLKGEPYESPMKPFGGIEQLAWSPDGKTIAYTCRKKTGKEYALSTNSDIYFYNLETGKTENKTVGMMGYDQNPVFSPDGKW